ncbi:MAG: RagB/SusD family nutrient uptake outer membrane protein [Bacteroidetes bacterium]|nr:RagB/SusD family nutrient uptake outer membrane protein [Bacteroidota bacterium]
MKKNILLILTSVLLLSSCDDLFNPAQENLKTIDQMYTDAAYAQGVLINAYRSIPTYYDNSDYATDDAVTNQKTNNYLRLATGSWSSNNNPEPLNQWSNAYAAIQYINMFLENVAKVTWTSDKEANKLFSVRMQGEAYGLRAMYMFYLLRSHAGFTSDGKLMGVPILTKYLDAQADFNLPRATFQDCLSQIYQDLDNAESMLPMEYNDITKASQIPTQFQSITSTVDIYNRVMGQYARQLFNGLIAKSFRSRVALLAASPAFQDATNKTTWANAADYAAAIIDYKGGVSSLPPYGITYYANTNNEIDALSNAANTTEIIWRENLATGNYDQEKANFPPTLNGTGYMNPTQNLVDAFPMANGYPVNYSDATKSGYDASNPYSKRDPRLTSYIIYNGNTEGVLSSKIYTGSLSGTNDGINVTTSSTRTGYYMKKRLRMDVNCIASAVTKKTHLIPRLRYTEFYLNYAEAANEAWGPTGTGSHSYSAYDVIKAIRKRALGITTDPYLDECKTDPIKMRALIRNERRLELCFESFRFWDLRRWKATLTETARGLDVTTSITNPFDVESRSYQDYMYYGPIPYSEMLKYSNLVQNKGW